MVVYIFIIPLGTSGVYKMCIGRSKLTVGVS